LNDSKNLAENSIHEWGSQVNEVNLNEIISVVVRRRKIIALVIVMSLIVGVGLTFKKKVYDSSGIIRLQPGIGEMYHTSPSAILSGESADKIASEVTVIQSNTLYSTVARELDLANNRDFWPGAKVGTHFTMDDPAVREAVILSMREKVKVVHDPKDEVIRITCRTTSPVMSTKIVNSIINGYVIYVFKMRYGSSQRASSWLIGQLDDLKSQVEKDQERITELQSKLGLIGLGEKDLTYLNAEWLDSLTKASAESTVSRILAEARLHDLQTSNLNLIEGEINPLNPTVTMAGGAGLLQSLRSTQASLSAEHAKLLSQYGANFPDVKQVKAQLDQIDRQVVLEQKRILNQAQLSYKAAVGNEAMTSEALAKKTSEIHSRNGDMVKYAILLHEYEAHRTLYEGLVKRLREANMTAGIEAGEIDIVDIAEIPYKSASPKAIIIILGSGCVGVILGIIAALLVEATMIHINTTAQAERLIDMPAIAILPHMQRGVDQKNSEQENNNAIDPAFLESVQTLRSSLLLSSPERPPQVVLFTSAQPGEGKTTISEYTALAFAQTKRKVLLVDCDMRRGALSRKLKLAAYSGLTNVLSGQTNVEDVIRKFTRESIEMFVLPMGHHSPNPSALINSKQMSELFEHLREVYDVIILDCAPMVSISDTLDICQYADAKVIVLRSGYSRISGAKHIRRITAVNNLNFLGIVMNDMEQQPFEYGYGYGYGYGKDQSNHKEHQA